MKRALVFQHMDQDHLGRFNGILAEDGVAVDTVMLHKAGTIPSLKSYDYLFVLGGAMDVWEEEAHPWLVTEKAAIREWVQSARPYMGICLGHQLLADAMGGKVGMAAEQELGVYDVTRSDADHRFFDGVAPNLTVFEWHHCEVQKLPPEAVNLASSTHSAVQAMAVGDNALGLQFHVEFDMDCIEAWQHNPAYIHAMENYLGPGSYPVVKQKARPIMSEYDKLARRIWANLKS